MIKYLLFLLLMLPACDKKELRGTKFIMNTLVEVKASGKSLSSLDPVWLQLKELDDKLSPYNPSSDISAVNRNAGLSSVRVSGETLDLLKKTLKFSSQTSGIFDPTVFPLVQLWDVTAKSPMVPSAALIKRALELVDFSQVSFSGGRVTLKHRDMRLDLGGIAKGYAVDLAVDTLKADGANEGLINAGGNIKVFGDRTWRVGIRHPRKINEVFATLELKDCAVATSGDYERYFKKDGKRYHHIFDLRTGYPANKAVCATVIAKEGWLSDALSTAVFILGPQKGLGLLKNYPGTEGIVVDTEGNVFVSEGLKDTITVKKIDLR